MLLTKSWNVNVFLVVKAILHYNVILDDYKLRSLYIFQGGMYTHIESTFKVVISILSLCF